MKDDIREKCIQELVNTHNNLVARRFTTMLENRENAEGKKLTDEEIVDLKNRFNAEIYTELLMKGGK